MDDEELVAGPTDVLGLAANGGNVDLVGVVVEGVGAAVRGDVDGVRGVHEV